MLADFSVVLRDLMCLKGSSINHQTREVSDGGENTAGAAGVQYYCELRY